MSTLYSRLLEICIDQGVGKPLGRDIERLTGLSSGRVAQIKSEADAARLGDESLRKVARQTGYSADWIQEGRGEKRAGEFVYGTPEQSALMASEPLPEVVEAADGDPPDGYIRFEQLSPTPAMGIGYYADEPVHVVRLLDLYEPWVREHIGHADPRRIKLMIPTGDSMLPIIKPGDLVFVDVEHVFLGDPGIYIVVVGGRLLLKRVLMRANGTVTIYSENRENYPDEESYPVAEAEQSVIFGGKVVAWWSLRKS